MNEEERVKQFYEKPCGDFAVIDISREDKTYVDKLVGVLKRLGVHSAIDRDRLLSTWKQYERNDVRKYMNR